MTGTGKLKRRGVSPKKQVADRPSAAIGDPALPRVVTDVVQHMAPLAQASQIAEPVVGRVAIQVSRSKYDPGHPLLAQLDQIRPPGGAPTPATPSLTGFVKPPSIR